MKEYRKTLDLSTGTSYTYVELGPIPDMPKWHQSAQPSRWPFPTPEAAFRFARAHSEERPDREVIIAYPDGRRWNGKEWVA
ncbi:hypothetical protein SEA_LAKES_75 [Mycobacterium phage Lakes]|uniref:Uncharacterized protein n=6 Tax=root TaxID=1 RepID=A0A8T8JDQ9_BPMD2|nr:hypothetical protein PBI_D29_68.1 [Mycobacterium phage D29]AGK85834.1 hypothetical protein Chy1_0067 [Mycobacterium phage Chy1]AOQ27907.1 hypothetical protein SEA_POMAR16_75 [Mycobacterium phage Pomar16]AXH48936.1 hypothetical protein SEA_TOMATHAN_75 [Mycobacterium phage Tomathan]QBP28733.1 hypothetical protein SEA_DBQU4N_75 [Mycobacterium phage DBQu4n]QFG08833.1 hypothetical protein SEA_NAJI_75 [Mycobacterium phage Naji]QJD52456.1 hypothetical protein PBI_D32_74 [Mycobacterium phage D32]